MTHTIPSGKVRADLWPDVAQAPSSLRARAGGPIAKSLFQGAIKRLPLEVRFPDGSVLGLGGPRMVIADPSSFYARLAHNGLIGLGEAYMAHEWEAEDLAAVMTVFAARVSKLIPQPLQALRGAILPHQPHRERNTVSNSRNNISRHYDLSNELFAEFLDETMSYSSAYFADLDAPDFHLLASAQQAKIDRLLDLAGVTEGSHVLEIGTGWGELALRAAQRGARVYSVTLSSEQKELAERRIARAGFSDSVQIELLDYRKVQGTFDAIVSVEMIEAVGFEFMPDYFQTLAARLRPGGAVGLQAITIGHERMLATRNSYTWVHKYIFPGGMIPSAELIAEQSALNGLTVENRMAFGQHYAQTLRLWDEQFSRNAAQVDELGFDETFRRMWHFYLAYSRAGFASGYLDVQQFQLRKSKG
ncbi:SAM-dependent methyltransferase [Psychromicrobium lacuslunae]|uniref:SAM-dependent methyltransferase n=1 Tax=Psychromicrobium lacuslunae TaxID=1618207 RepID=UPI0005D3C592|nr:cyclopropane-fatty-acyl-phospholipid synthase family protein [Psychromicrobium lacuslunae]